MISKKMQRTRNELISSFRRKRTARRTHTENALVEKTVARISSPLSVSTRENRRLGDERRRSGQCHQLLKATNHRHRQLTFVFRETLLNGKPFHGRCDATQTIDECVTNGKPLYCSTMRMSSPGRINTRHRDTDVFVPTI